MPAGTKPPEFPIQSVITTKNEVATLTIKGDLPRIQILVNQNITQNEMDEIRDEYGNTVGQHELEHVRIWVEHWNALRDNLSVLDGEYCPAKCASIAFNAAKVIRDIFHSSARIVNVSFDLRAYPKIIDQTDGERKRLDDLIEGLEDNIEKSNRVLDNLDNQWKANKCQKK